MQEIEWIYHTDTTGCTPQTFLQRLTPPKIYIHLSCLREIIKMFLKLLEVCKKLAVETIHYYIIISFTCFRSNVSDDRRQNWWELSFQALCLTVLLFAKDWNCWNGTEYDLFSSSFKPIPTSTTPMDVSMIAFILIPSKVRSWNVFVSRSAMALFFNDFFRNCRDAPWYHSKFQATFMFRRRSFWTIQNTLIFSKQLALNISFWIENIKSEKEWEQSFGSAAGLVAADLGCCSWLLALDSLNKVVHLKFNTKMVTTTMSFECSKLLTKVSQSAVKWLDNKNEIDILAKEYGDHIPRERFESVES